MPTTLLPAGTNHLYHGSPAAAWFLMLAGVLEVLPGCIHFFLPDGGAGVIAGIDLSVRGATIIAIFAWFGAVQIPTGLLLLLIGWRHRNLVPAGLLWIIIARGLMTYDGWFGKGAVGGHHPPEHFASPVAVVLALSFLVLACRQKPEQRS